MSQEVGKWLVNELFHLLINLPQLQGDSHHQDENVYSSGLQAKPLFVTIAGKGDNPNDTILFDEGFYPPAAWWNNVIQLFSPR